MSSSIDLLPDSPPSPEIQPQPAKEPRRIEKSLVAIALVLAGIALWVPEQFARSLAFTGDALLAVAPWLVLSVALAAWAKASGADRIIASAFAGRPARAVSIAALLGALSPFCSCGVVPVVAGLLAAGVPLAPVMAFWVSSPLMDPTMFVMTAASLGWEFAVAKTIAAVAIGLAGGALTHALTARGLLATALRAAPGAAPADGLPATAAPNPARCKSGCAPKASLRWRIWRSAQQRAQFAAAARSSLWMLGGWMSFAFLLESLMIAYLPASTVASLLGQSPLAIPAAVALGIPAYFNGYAALPMIRGLVDLGMNPAVGMAFLVAGGMTSIPAATAVWALVRPRVFAIYLALAVAGALAVSYAYALWLAAIG